MTRFHTGYFACMVAKNNIMGVELTVELTTKLSWKLVYFLES